ncbi:hypothetical protein CONCODRAFT_167943 [Conidiobolus coronatus NRRL 28638]|uniref:Uncharacterized protein n=1 Tax=Conidiobolus coronatus (strain ATCC 28846 / CBS 209.66 / NRRL 28638) TaxID=796925 RepID=A0A137NWD9_CONC2|nr:hypothetical protein CONCODRAFT_167943 [Conidiobolus coronatus NRRL 28638]|eukprot:KXN66949.1 hypothetical protein CONCODRAFT_167943 [Conidiobolus coronatus NRRL 28638]
MKYILGISLALFAKLAQASCDVHKYDDLLQTTYNRDTNKFVDRQNTTHSLQLDGLRGAYYIPACYDKTDQFPPKAHPKGEYLYVHLRKDSTVFKFYCEPPQHKDLICSESNAV